MKKPAAHEPDMHVVPISSEVTIPVSQIDHYKDNTVYLKLNKHAVEALPSIPVRHSWAKKD